MTLFKHEKNIFICRWEQPPEFTGVHCFYIPKYTVKNPLIYTNVFVKCYLITSFLRKNSTISVIDILTLQIRINSVNFLEYFYIAFKTLQASQMMFIKSCSVKKAK